MTPEERRWLIPKGAANAIVIDSEFPFCALCNQIMQPSESYHPWHPSFVCPHCGMAIRLIDIRKAIEAGATIIPRFQMSGEEERLDA